MNWVAVSVVAIAVLAGLAAALTADAIRVENVRTRRLRRVRDAAYDRLLEDVYWQAFRAGDAIRAEQFNIERQIRLLDEAPGFSVIRVVS